MDDTENRLGRAELVEFEQGDGDGPFAHIAQVVDRAVKFADAPIALPRTALRRARLPETVEMLDIRKPAGNIPQQTPVDVSNETPTVLTSRGDGAV